MKKKVNKKVKKTIILTKKAVKKVTPKMSIKVKAKVKPKLIVKLKAKAKSESKIVSKTKTKSVVSSKTKIKAKIVAKVKTPVKISVSSKNKAKKIIVKKPALTTKTKKIITKKPVAPVKTKKIVVKKLAVPVKAKKIATTRPASSARNSVAREVKKIQIKKSVNKAVPNKAKTKSTNILDCFANSASNDETRKTGQVDVAKKTIKVIQTKKVDKVNMTQTSKIKKSDNLNPTVDKPYSFHKEEEYMNEEQVAHFKQILLAWKEGLMESVDSTMHHMQDDAANYPDPVDRASQEEGFSLELRTRDRERKLLKKIDETLVRINEQDYGYCDDCGAEIGIRRLEARPTANQCIECKTIAEIREKQIGEIN